MTERMSSHIGTALSAAAAVLSILLGVAGLLLADGGAALVVPAAAWALVALVVTASRDGDWRSRVASVVTVALAALVTLPAVRDLADPPLSCDGQQHGSDETGLDVLLHELTPADEASNDDAEILSCDMLTLLSGDGAPLPVSLHAGSLPLPPDRDEPHDERLAEMRALLDGDTGRHDIVLSGVVDGVNVTFDTAIRPGLIEEVPELAERMSLGSLHDSVRRPADTPAVNQRRSAELRRLVTAIRDLLLGVNLYDEGLLTASDGRLRRVRSTGDVEPARAVDLLARLLRANIATTIDKLTRAEALYADLRNRAGNSDSSTDRAIARRAEFGLLEVRQARACNEDESPGGRGSLRVDLDQLDEVIAELHRFRSAVIHDTDVTSTMRRTLALKSDVKLGVAHLCAALTGRDASASFDAGAVALCRVLNDTLGTCDSSPREADDLAAFTTQRRTVVEAIAARGLERYLRARQLSHVGEITRTAMLKDALRWYLAALQFQTPGRGAMVAQYDGNDQCDYVDDRPITNEAERLRAERRSAYLLALAGIHELLDEPRCAARATDIVERLS